MSADIIPFGKGSYEARMSGSSHCPICGEGRPHNHSLFEVEAFHRCFENEERHYGLITFRTDEVRKLLKQRARGVNDRPDKMGNAQ